MSKSQPDSLSTTTTSILTHVFAPRKWIRDNDIRYLYGRCMDILEFFLILGDPYILEYTIQYCIANRFLFMTAGPNVSRIEKFHNTWKPSNLYYTPIKNPIMYIMCKLTVEKDVVYWFDTIIAKSTHMIWICIPLISKVSTTRIMSIEARHTKQLTFNGFILTNKS